MKTASAKEIRDELKDLTASELTVLIQRLARFKKENKELLTYLLFEEHHEEDYIEGIKAQIDEQFAAINTPNYYYIKKAVRKILKAIKIYIRYSGKKETEVALLIHFCRQLRELKPSITRNKVLQDLYDRQLLMARVRLSTLHEDLQYDYDRELNMLEV